MACIGIWKEIRNVLDELESLNQTKCFAGAPVSEMLCISKREGYLEFYLEILLHQHTQTRIRKVKKHVV